MKRNNNGMLFKKRAHDIALYTYATPMNDAHIVNAVAKALADVLFDYAGDFVWREWV